MLTPLLEIYEENRQFHIREVLVNVDHINFAREDITLNEKMRDTKTLKELDERVKFTRLFINRGNMGHEMVVIGTIEDLNKKFFKSHKVKD
jgi:hypothetical protein